MGEQLSDRIFFKTELERADESANRLTYGQPVVEPHLSALEWDGQCWSPNRPTARLFNNVR